MINFIKRFIEKAAPSTKILLLAVCAAGVSQIHCLGRPSLLLGVENLSSDLIRRLSSPDMRVGLVTNQTGKGQQGQRNVDLLVEKGINVTKLFAPEHGLDGKGGAGEKIKDTIDKQTGIPVASLYGSGSGKKIKKALVNDIDVLMFDIQDSGMRHYTYISTMYEVMEAAGRYDKKVVVLDRPNPLGMIMEGPLVKPKFKSFIARIPVPVRHGMTVGELADYCNKHVLDKPIDLEVVRMRHYNRKRDVPKDLLAPLSPGLRSLDSCLCYSFMGLLGEVGGIGIGLGSDNPFQCITISEKSNFPKSKWRELRALLNTCGIRTKVHSYYSKKRKKTYNGLLLNIRDINSFSSFDTFLSIVDFFKKAGIQFNFAKTFNTAIGTDMVKSVIQGKTAKYVLAQEVNSSLRNFYARAQSSFMYKPFPRVMRYSTAK